MKFDVVLEPEATYYPVSKDLSDKIQLEAHTCRAMKLSGGADIGSDIGLDEILRQPVAEIEIRIAPPGSRTGQGGESGSQLVLVPGPVDILTA